MPGAIRTLGYVFTGIIGPLAVWIAICANEESPNVFHWSSTPTITAGPTY